MSASPARRCVVDRRARVPGVSRRVITNIQHPFTLWLCRHRVRAARLRGGRRRARRCVPSVRRSARPRHRAPGWNPQFPQPLARGVRREEGEAVLHRGRRRRRWRWQPSGRGAAGAGAGAEAPGLRSLGARRSFPGGR